MPSGRGWQAVRCSPAPLSDSPSGLVLAMLSLAATGVTFPLRFPCRKRPRPSSTSDRRHAGARAARARAVEHCSDYGVADGKLVRDQQAGRNR